MLKKSRARPLVYTIAILAAFILAILGIGHDIAAQRQPDSVLVILMTAMALGMLVSAYGLYVERHAIRALVLRHSHVQRRLARRKPKTRLQPAISYPRPSALAFRPVRG
jgi:hypothetical protein